jgi:cytochrome c oxidase subunit 4
MTHIATRTLYVKVFLALMVATAITVAASRLNLGHSGNIALGLAIAVTKASLVAAFFMHLKYDRGWVRVFAFYPLGLFLILLLALWPDIAFRLGDAARSLATG